MKIKKARDLGPQLQDNAHSMIGQDGAYSIKLTDGTLFYFGDTLLGKRTEGESLWYPGGKPVGPKDMSGMAGIKKMLNNTGLITKQPTLADGLKDYKYVVDGDKNIKVLLTLLDSEDPDWDRIWCLHGIELVNKKYLFFVKVRTIEEGIFPVNFEIIGSGMAVDVKGNWEFRRILNKDGSDILWKAEEPHFSPAILHDKTDNVLYMYGVLQGSDKVQNCYLAKVHADNIEDLELYEYYIGQNQWGKDLQKAVPVFSGMPNELSVSYNNYYGKYLAVHSLDLSGKIVARTADTPWGKWSDPFTLWEALPNHSADLPYPILIYAGKEHPMFSKNNGKTIYITYIEFEEYYPHLIEIEFE